MVSRLRAIAEQVPLSCPAARVAHSWGGPAQLKVGAGDVFMQHRPYQRGDDVRYIDWRASARSEGYVTLQYEQPDYHIWNITICSSPGVSFAPPIGFAREHVIQSLLYWIRVRSYKQQDDLFIGVNGMSPRRITAAPPHFSISLTSPLGNAVSSSRSITVQPSRQFSIVVCHAWSPLSEVSMTVQGSQRGLLLYLTSSEEQSPQAGSTVYAGIKENRSGWLPNRFSLAQYKKSLTEHEVNLFACAPSPYWTKLTIGDVTRAHNLFKIVSEALARIR